MDVLCLDLANGSAVGRRGARKVCRHILPFGTYKYINPILAFVCRPVAHSRSSFGFPSSTSRLLGCTRRFSVGWYRHFDADLTSGLPVWCYGCQVSVDHPGYSVLVLVRQAHQSEHVVNIEHALAVSSSK